MRTSSLLSILCVSLGLGTSANAAVSTTSTALHSSTVMLLGMDIFTSSPFKSSSELKEMSENSPISAVEASKLALQFYLKGKFHLKENLDAWRELRLDCLSYKEGEYADYYFFPHRRKIKLHYIDNLYTSRGIYVNAQTGETVYREDEGEAEKSKVYKGGYEDLYGVEESRMSFDSYMDEDSSKEEFLRARAPLARYLKKHYPTQNVENYYRCYKMGTSYFFPLPQLSFLGMAGFEVDPSKDSVSLIMRPMVRAGTK